MRIVGHEHTTLNKNHSCDNCCKLMTTGDPVLLVALTKPSNIPQLIVKRGDFSGCLHFEFLCTECAWVMA